MKLKNQENILNLMKSYQKVDYFERKNKNFEVKEYFKTMTLENSRVNFGLRNQMTRTIQSHFSSDKAYSKELWTCRDCKSKIDSIFHAKNCIFFENLRQKYPNLDSDDQLVEYFKEIIKIRDDKAQLE